MSISIVHETTFLKHEGGTKFYEVIQLHAPDIGKHLVIKRWGKSSAMVAGGEIQFETHPNARKAGAAAGVITRSKEGRGYTRQSITPGLHGYGGEINSDNVESLLVAHYGRANAEAILCEFGPELATKITGRKADFMIIDELNDVVSEEPAPEPERGDSWGSW